MGREFQVKRLAGYLVLLAAAGLWPLNRLDAQETPSASEPVLIIPESGMGYPLPWTRGEPPLPPNDFYTKGIWNFQFMTGPYFSPVASIGPDQPSYNFMIQGFRLGRTTSIGFDSGLLRGSLEPVMELALGESLSDLGNFFVGPSWMLRYNFVQPDRRLVPYYQIGGGFQYNDAYEDQTQNSLGQSIQFILQTQIGARWYISERSTIDLEGGYIHVSNANMSNRNGGINAFGATLGLSYFFGGPHRPARY